MANFPKEKGETDISHLTAAWTRSRLPPGSKRAQCNYDLRASQDNALVFCSNSVAKGHPNAPHRGRIPNSGDSILIIALGVGRLLTSQNIVPGVNWVWVKGRWLVSDPKSMCVLGYSLPK
jgi:hypothetical protein